MTSPDSNADATSSKYNVQIGEGQGIVIGDNPQVVQQFYGTPSEPQVDLTAAEATYRQKVVDAYKWLNFSGFDSPDLSLANVPLEDVFVRLTLTVEKVIREPVPPEKSSRAEQRESRQRERVITVQEPIELGQALEQPPADRGRTRCRQEHAAALACGDLRSRAPTGTQPIGAVR